MLENDKSEQLICSSAVVEFFRSLQFNNLCFRAQDKREYLVIIGDNFFVNSA